ncbi:hypothetical protein HD806DRAFT_511776 [Xylariaceae sp. AK1471]|nr:hypothetical protein HD806DRAFT_511776 [Xylariaceae sp. AK1471]
MDSPASAARGRGRASARKRHTFPAGPSSHPSSGTITAAEPIDQHSSETPSASIASSSFSFETPSPSASRGTRTRGRAAEGTIPSSDDLDSKGGRSLRKRARVDYTFDHVDEDASDSNKTIPSTTRALKRRRTDTAFHDIDTDEEFSAAHMKRRSSEQLPPPSSTIRRRNQARKATVEPQTDRHIDDVEVQDTIEVGGHHSEHSDESTLRRMSSNTSSGSSNNDSKPSHMTASFDSIPTPRKSHPNLMQIDFSDDYHQDSVEQPEAARMSLPYTSNHLADESLHASCEHLTPYIEGTFVKWPSAQLEVEGNSEPQPLQQDAAEEAAEDQLITKADTMQEDTPINYSIMPELTPIDGGVGETPAVSPSAMDTRANSPAVDVELSYLPPPPRRPIAFKQTREASEFISLFENYQSLQPNEIWERLEVANRALVAWQDEFNELRKITDDEDNAARYRQEEAAFEHRVKMATSKDPDANPVPKKDFVVKGIRAERPNPETAYARYQDTLMAVNYDFEYDDKESMIGYQDPLQQKPGAGKARLRNRPKQTAKAAEADDGIIVHGKRSRKPAMLFDMSEAPSRSSTPVPTQRRRRRAGNAIEENSETNPAAPISTNSSAEQPTPKKKGKGGRPRKHPLPVPIPEDISMPTDEIQRSAEQVEEQKPTRKRRRRTAEVEAFEATKEEEAPATNGVDRKAPAKVGLRHTNPQLSEVPSGSFYTSSMQSTNAEDDSRPATSSSTATQSTVASTSNNYQLREKRQKKFSLNPDDDGGEPKPKRVRRSKKTQVEDFALMPIPAPVPTPSPMPVQQPILEPLPTPKPPTKIKLKNYTAPVPVLPPTSVPTPNPFSVPSSSSSTPLSSNGTSNGAANGTTDPADPKDYNQMTKSEKMSHSMKARWASGSMSQAVAKRRATLANKKQAVKAGEPNQPLEVAPTIITQP